MEKMQPFALFGAGKVYLDVLGVNNQPTGLALKGNCTKMSAKVEQELITEEGAAYDNLGQTIASVAIPKPLEGTIEFNQVDPEIFAMVFLGTNSPMNQTAGQVTNQSLNTQADRLVLLGKYKVQDVEVSGEGGVTYVEGQDYTVNARVGGITALSTGAIPANGVVQVKYAWPDIQGQTTRSMTKSDVRARILWEGVNYADGREFIVNAPQVRFAASTDFNFQSADDKKFLRASFNLTYETPVGAAAPFEITWLS